MCSIRLLTDVFSTVIPSTLFKLNVRNFWPLRSTVCMLDSGPNLTVTNRLWFACNHSRANILSMDAFGCGVLKEISLTFHGYYHFVLTSQSVI